MDKNKKYYQKIDLIRLLSCFAVFFYHLGFLKGGYLAVCTFFVLSGYLSCISSFQKNHFSIREYYISRFKKIYLPLLVVVSMTLVIFSFCPQLVWLNLKPETTSVLLGYNNFWQIGANLDYFARHIDSPFMHFWYMGIYLQLEFIFPFIFLLLKKVESRFSNTIPIIILSILSVFFTGYSIYASFHFPLMSVYYHTLTRVFSYLFGLLFGFLHSYQKTLRVSRIEKYHSYLFYSYIFLLILCFVFIDSNCNLFVIWMLLVTIISCRMLDYGVCSIKSQFNLCERVIHSLSSVSYEVYLFQYPIIYFFQFLEIPFLFKYIIIIVITFFLSYLLSFASKFHINPTRVDTSQKDFYKYAVQYSICFLFFCFTITGLNHYFMEKDHTKEMTALKEQLAANEKMMAKKQKEFQKQSNAEQEDWKLKLQNFENGEEALKEVVSNLALTGVGDSVMLGAVSTLYQKFPNGYFDALKNRTDYEGVNIIRNLKYNGMLGSPVLISLGTNGQGPESLKYEIIDLVEDRDIYLVNVVNDYEVHVNHTIYDFVSRYPNIYLVDWAGYSSGHPEYFVADGIHLTGIGREAYTNCIFDTIYQHYLEEYNKEKEKVLKEYDDYSKEQYHFIGNDLLLNISNDLSKEYQHSNYIIQKEIRFETIYSDLEELIEKDQLSYHIVFILDSSIQVDSNLSKVIKLLQDYQVTFVTTNPQLIEKLPNQENLQVINFYDVVSKHSDYLMADRYHLTEKGNKVLLKTILNNK